MSNDGVQCDGGRSDHYYTTTQFFPDSFLHKHILIGKNVCFYKHTIKVTSKDTTGVLCISEVLEAMYEVSLRALNGRFVKLPQGSKTE